MNGISEDLAVTTAVKSSFRANGYGCNDTSEELELMKKPPVLLKYLGIKPYYSTKSCDTTVRNSQHHKRFCAGGAFMEGPMCEAQLSQAALFSRTNALFPVRQVPFVVGCSVFLRNESKTTYFYCKSYLKSHNTNVSHLKLTPICLHNSRIINISVYVVSLLAQDPPGVCR